VTDPTPPQWHALSAAEALKRLEATQDGLSAQEAAARLARHGANRLPQAAARGPLRRLLAQFDNLLIYVLLAAAALSLALDHARDAAVILAVVLINALIGFLQEGRAERALAAIRGMIDPTASVLRDGRRESAPADTLVPGDIALLEAGDRVPADLRLIRARGLKMDESALTGESVAVDKLPEPVAADASLGDRASMAFAGAFVAAGGGAGVVVATGPDTELGRVGAMLGAVETLKTPLLRQMDGFARRLTAAILGLSALTFALATLARGYAPDAAFMAVVGLAVAAIPEGLPAIMTITLAIGVQRMAARNALIRRLPAVETLGAVSVICTDKTGTLTRNEMIARDLLSADGESTVEGVGYAPEGAIGGADGPARAALIEAGLLCNDAALREGPEGWRAEGDPMEGALVALAMKAGLDPAEARAARPRVDAAPFDARRRFMATLHADGTIFIKGAPERVIAMCDRLEGGGAFDAGAWEGKAGALAAEGRRVLAFARNDGAGDALDAGALEDGAALLGLIGFIDPPRAEAAEAIAACRAAGVRVLMITGDHVSTAREIARQLGLAEDPVALSGADVDALDDEALRAALAEAAVFARTAPEHKLRLVEALQARGLIVAMTGDGVNDAPALKRADVGVAMGLKGSEAAKEAADMVLADDNFASITAAVREGRTVYDNLMKVIAWTLPTSGGEALIILAAIALGFALPITPLQILWVNMVTAVALGLTLAFEPTEPDAMLRPPRPADRAILSGVLLWRILYVSALFVAGGFGVWFWALAQGFAIETARTMVVNTLVAMEIFYLFSVQGGHDRPLSLRGAAANPAVWIGVALVLAAQAALTFAPPLQAAFDTTPLPAGAFAPIFGAGAALLVLAEAEKWALRRLRPRPARAAPQARDSKAQ